MRAEPAPRDAVILGYAGVIPFAALATVIAIGWPLPAELALRSFMAYSAIILSFLGGIRWGAAAARDDRGGLALLLSVLPSLWAFACLLLPGAAVALWALLAGFVALGVLDRMRPAAGLPDWMAGLRLRLTALVAACHVLAAASL
jgi:hypothetical protein